MHLRTGRILEGKIEKETDSAVVLQVRAGRVHIARADISLIERDEELAEWEVKLRWKREKERRRRAQERAKREAEEAAAKEEGGGGAGASEQEDLALRRLVEDLASDDADTRSQARALLEREGKRAVPVLAETLFHRSIHAREGAAFLLGKLNARESVRSMLIALAGAVPDSKKVRFWQRPFVRALRTSLVKVTGKNLSLSLHAVNQDKVVQKYIEWWEGKPDNKGGVPQGACLTWDTPQIGETEIAEDDPEREKKLWATRRIGTERASYPVPAGLGAGGG